MLYIFTIEQIALDKGMYEENYNCWISWSV